MRPQQDDNRCARRRSQAPLTKEKSFAMICSRPEITFLQEFMLKKKPPPQAVRLGGGSMSQIVRYSPGLYTRYDDGNCVVPLGESKVPALWPWDGEWWKPSTRERDLEKAGALLSAAIDIRMRRSTIRQENIDAKCPATGSTS